MLLIKTISPFQDQDSYGGGLDAANAFSGELTGLFWLRKALSPDEVDTLYKDTLVNRDSASYPQAETVLSWNDILTKGSINGGTYTYSIFSLLGNTF